MKACTTILVVTSLLVGLVGVILGTKIPQSSTTEYESLSDDHFHRFVQGMASYPEEDIRNRKDCIERTGSRYRFNSNGDLLIHNDDIAKVARYCS